MARPRKYPIAQELTDNRVLASIGSVGDAYDNAMAESFVDSLKTELIKDRVWRMRSQLELAVVEWVSWFNNVRIHSEIGDLPPAELEDLYARQGGLRSLPLDERRFHLTRSPWNLVRLKGL